jgi:hypothetical protein
VAKAAATTQQDNYAEKGDAGNDTIYADWGPGHGNDEVAGDAMARSEGWYWQDAIATANNTAVYGSGDAGNDEIHAGGGDNKVAGDAMAVNTGDDASAYANNTA